MKTNVSHANKMLRAAVAALTLTILPLLNSCDAVWGTSLDYSTDGYGGGVNLGLYSPIYNGYNGPYWWNGPGYIPSWGYLPSPPPVRPGITVRPPIGASGNVRPPQRPSVTPPANSNPSTGTRPGINPSWNTNPGIQLPGNNAKPGEGFMPSKPANSGSSTGTGLRPGRH